MESEIKVKLSRETLSATYYWIETETFAIGNINELRLEKVKKLVLTAIDVKTIRKALSLTPMRVYYKIKDSWIPYSEFR